MKAIVFILALLGFAAFASAASVECVVCEFLIKELEGQVSSNSTTAQIEAALDQVCGDLPSTLRSECNSLVAQYTPQIVAAILGGLTPDKVCQTIGACTSAQLLAVRSIQASLQCAICEFAIRELDQEIVANGTVSQIEKEFETVCNDLPSTIRKECDSLVVLYTPELVSALANKIDPQVVCSFIHLCTASKPLFNIRV